ncbi:MAG: polyribonucleotide nucleotidyltransferase [Candidatus Pacebacteria bacterium]|nr:polyribonucleotide nucleotidyltransferase [Candidatus Paceibacterota bacterium]MDD5356807.1 polyribonucleotide nucleotidyltransferase [Candidatus Paceibacterota bacterium]
MKKKEYSIEIGGKVISAQFTDLADQTNGSAIVRCGNTVVLATAVMSEHEKDGDWFPLTVDYEERFYASGKILGSRFMRREGRPTDEAILSGRIVDRTIRPLFNQAIRNEVQVVITILSIDTEDPDVLAVLASSLALGTSNIPWAGPVSAIRVGKKLGANEFLINPNYENRNATDFELDLLACGKDSNINMIEVGGKEIENEVIASGLEKCSEEIEKLQAFQAKIITEIGKPKKEIALPILSEAMKALYEETVSSKLEKAVFSGAGHEHIHALKKEWKNNLEAKFGKDEKFGLAFEHFENKINDLLHKEAIEKERRPDGRKMDEVRPLYVQAGGISPIIHGTGIFYRGGTHVLSALTLGGPGDSQILDGMEIEGQKRFMHHYNFPPFSSGETGRMGGTNRRMIGHGALAEKALLAVIPAKEVFPYTIRIVSESLASNGSTSMASTCASTIALMDAGVPISAPVAGIASGLMLSAVKSGGKTEYKYKVLTDIQGPEDHHGDMDFKVAGTKKGITAIQMDVKVDGVPIFILKEALEKAKNARHFILDAMTKEIAAPRTEISSNAPKIIIIKIKQDQIGSVIGPGGKMIKEIKEKTGVEIDIEDDGSVFITGSSDGAKMAAQIISDMTREFKRGERFEGVVTKVVEFGAFVRFAGQTEGLVHVSEIAPFRIDIVGNYLKEGDKIPVILKDIDEKGRIKLSLKDADPSFIKPKIK